MKELQKDNRGVIAILLVVLIVLIGLGWVVWHAYSVRSQKSKASQSQTQVEVVEPQTKTFVTQYEKLKITYPADLTLTDTSAAADPGDEVVGMDHIKISKGHYTLSIQTGIFGVGGGCAECTIPFSEQVSVLGHNYYLNYVSNDNANISAVGLSDTADQYINFIPGKNILTLSSGGATLIGINIRANMPQPHAATVADADFMALKQIVADLSY